ncbi:MAG: putative BsuMI modification methylase subunit YdiO [Fimbriimonadales bacterium]|nr:MAG: putative BsuMI modification methylase subunit YdiO [Fimbriimonadales bacterium]
MIAERYTVHRGWVERELSLGSRSFSSRMADVSRLGNEAPAWSRWWRSYLRGVRPEFRGYSTGNLGIVDLFCGCGGLTLGTQEAARAAGLRPAVRLAVDTDKEALAVYARNLGPERALHADAGTLVDFHIVGWGRDARFAYPPALLHRALQAVRGSVDLVVAGPPCEGHSNLNNRTRRADPRNLLYLDAVAIGIAMDATAIVIENVPDILHDRSRVADTAVSLLKGSGYDTTQGVLAADELGLPQTRRRFFLVGSRSGVLDLQEVARSLAKEPTTVRWAIEDLVDVAQDPVMDSVPALSAENRLRIDYLFDHDLYDLPDHMRPACHRNGHTYPSVYGRLRWDCPAGTITTGFVTPGRGRFIHPSRRRPLTPREAARLQGFPDWYKFHAEHAAIPKKNALAKWIGDAVPPMLGYVAILSVLHGFLVREAPNRAARTETPCLD